MRIKIHSTVDLITNSSTELFCVVKGKAKDQILEILDGILKEFGCTSVDFTISSMYEEYRDENGDWHDKEIEGVYEIGYSYELAHEPCTMIKNRVKEIFGGNYEEN